MLCGFYSSNGNILCSDESILILSHFLTLLFMQIIRSCQRLTFTTGTRCCLACLWPHFPHLASLNRDFVQQKQTLVDRPDEHLIAHERVTEAISSLQNTQLLPRHK